MTKTSTSYRHCSYISVAGPIVLTGKAHESLSDAGLIEEAVKRAEQMGMLLSDWEAEEQVLEGAAEDDDRISEDQLRRGLRIMAATLTRESLTAAVEALYDERAAGGEEVGIALDAIAGGGTPASDAYAESLGPDYICALEDGTIAAWGADIVRSGYTDRELVFIAPAEQMVAA